MDQFQFDALWADFAVDFAGFARKRLGPDLAEDAILEAYVRARQLLPRYNHVCRKMWFGWALRILSFVCSEIRGQELKHSHNDEPSDIVGCADDPQATAVATVEAIESRSILRRLIDAAELPGMQRTIVEAYLAEEPTDVTARRFAMTESNVRAHLSCAVQRLRRVVTPQAGDFADPNI